MKNEVLAEWIRGMSENNLGNTDMVRALGYARDLEQGLAKVRSYPQGVTVFGSARVREGDKYYDMARLLGKLLANNGHAVITGGGPGIMEGANRGAFEYGGRSIGLNIELEHEQSPNPYLTDMMEFKYFFARKVMLAMSGKVYVYFPGGFGTMDELTEILILMQEEKMPRMPVFLIGKSFWKPLDKFFVLKMGAAKLVDKGDTKIYKMTDDLMDVVRAANRVGHLLIRENVYDGYSDSI